MVRCLDYVNEVALAKEMTCSDQCIGCQVKRRLDGASGSKTKKETYRNAREGGGQRQ